MNTLLNNQENLPVEGVSANVPAPALDRVVDEGVPVATITGQRLQKILVAVDFSAGCLAALNYVAALAGRFASRVSLLHVVVPDPLLSSLRNAPMVADEATAEHRAEERLSRLMEHRIPPANQGEPLVHRGKLVRQIVETARSTNTHILVLGRAPRQAWDLFLAPSRLKQILRQAPCPTLIVPENFLARHWEAKTHGTAPPGQRVLVPVDGSELSSLALRWGAALVEPAGGRLSLFFVPGLYAAPSWSPTGPAHELRARTADALEQRLWAWAKETLPPGLSVHILREVGMRAAEVLAVMATREHCDLMVLRSRSVSFRQRLLDGCLAEQLAWVASCPVLCLPEPVAIPNDTRPTKKNKTNIRAKLASASPMSQS